MEELARYIRGCRGYFVFYETPELLIYLTRRVRLRLRGSFVAAVENTAPSASDTAQTGGTSAVGQQYGWERTRPIVSRTGPSPCFGLSNAYLKSLGLP